MTDTNEVRSPVPEPSGGAPTPVPEVSGGAHFPCLDAYRGVGMTMVLLNHAAYATNFYATDNAVVKFVGPFVARLDLSVPMFFVMSGFLLYRPFAKATLTGRAPLPLRTFYRRRALRVFPAYWAALIGIALIFGLQIAGMKGWLGNIFLLQAFGAPVKVCNDSGVCHVGYGITQAWSIGVEITFYLLLPLFAASVSRLTAAMEPRRRLIAMLGSLAVLYAVGTAFRAYVVVVDPSWGEQSLLWLPMFLDLFAVGMTLAVLSTALSAGQVLPRAVRWFGDHPALCWTIAAVVWFGVTRMKFPTKPFGLHDSDGSSDYLPRQFAYGVAAAVWLWPAIFGDQTRGRLRRMLASRPLVYLGGISLSFYLWHLAIIEQAKYWTIPDYAGLVERAAHPRPGNTLDGVGTFQGPYLKIVLISWIVSFLVASVLFRLVELPFLRLKDQPLWALLRVPGRRRPAGGEPGSPATGEPAV